LHAAPVFPRVHPSPLFSTPAYIYFCLLTLCTEAEWKAARMSRDGHPVLT
jgi:hypothetical protein